MQLNQFASTSNQTQQAFTCAFSDTQKADTACAGGKPGNGGSGVDNRATKKHALKPFASV